MDSKEVWVAEYSDSENCFNVDTLEKVISSNVRTILNGVPKDYKIFFVGSTIEEANEACELMRQIINKVNE